MRAAQVESGTIVLPSTKLGLFAGPQRAGRGGG
jgi:hypothetical protein